MVLLFSSLTNGAGIPRDDAVVTTTKKNNAASQKQDNDEAKN